MNRRPAEREYCVEHAALSDVGLCRSNNQDSLIVSPADSVQPGQTPGHLLVVADGMGAHAAGEVASQMAVEIVLRVYRNQANGKPADALRQAITTANSEIFARGAQSDELRGMGTTVSALLLLPDEAIIAHVGDSRVYRLRGNDLEQLTFDHSLVWEICDAENVIESEVPAFVPRNIITRSVGPTSEVAVDLEGPFYLRTGDVFLLCSDGLSGQVEMRRWAPSSGASTGGGREDVACPGQPSRQSGQHHPDRGPRQPLAAGRRRRSLRPTGIRAAGPESLLADGHRRGIVCLGMVIVRTIAGDSGRGCRRRAGRVDGLRPQQAPGAAGRRSAGTAAAGKSTLHGVRLHVE